ncbi:MAG: type VI secretion system tube protein Hcp [Micropruina sp.]|nr:type VI secretion system tube protein Hcp [Micropruina sp.]
MNDPLTASRRSLLVGGGLGAAALLNMSGATLANAAPAAFIAPGHSSGGVDWWLMLDGIAGESTDRDHPHQIDVRAMDWQAVQKATSPSGSSSKDISLAFDTSAASPVILKKCAQGSVVRTARISGRKSGEGQRDYLWWDFTDVRFRSYDVAFTDGAPLDVVTFSFTQVTMTYRPQDAKGGLGTPITVTWNVKTDKVS